MSKSKGSGFVAGVVLVLFGLYLIYTHSPLGWITALFGVVVLAFFFFYRG